MWKMQENYRKEIVLQEMHAVKLLTISFISFIRPPLALSGSETPMALVVLKLFSNVSLIFQVVLPIGEQSSA